MQINYLEISTEALRYNAKTVKDYVGCPCIAVVKCDGYGVTITKAAKIWQECGAELFAVSEPHEALELRAAGFHEDILLLAPVGDRITFRALLEADVVLTVSDEHNAEFYKENSGDRKVRAHVAVDTGMGRFGVKWTDTEQLKRIYSKFNFQFEGIFSHFSRSFEKKYKLTRQQLQRFLKAVAVVAEAGYDVGMRHIANSCAALRFPETRLDAVRIGSAFVGELCAEVPVELKKAGVLKAQVVDVKALRKGDTTGYASVCRVKHDTEAVVVAIGHECGFGYMKGIDNLPLKTLLASLYHTIRERRHPPYVMYGDKKLKLIGRVGSQYSLFEADGIEMDIGDYVTAGANMLFPYRRRKFI